MIYSSYPQVIHLCTHFPLSITIELTFSYCFLGIIHIFKEIHCEFVDKSVNNVGIYVCIVHNSG